MKWSTIVNIAEHKGFLTHSDKMLLIGSCFTENIGQLLQQSKFDVDINPFGTLYNPESIAMGLRRLMEQRPFTLDELNNDGGLWYSYHHHGAFSSYNSEETLAHINRRYEYAANQLPQCQKLIVTFGTAYVYRLENGKTVANCHKQPASHFKRNRLSVAEIVSEWEALITQLIQYAPQCDILFTVSPIRHLSDGAHNNQLSKSTLLLAVEQLCHTHPDKCQYFPSYEIVMDELRDYRFYAEDMAHPTPQAVSYIYQRLQDTYFDNDTTNIATECSKIYRSLSHRPLKGTNDEKYKDFVAKLIAQTLEIEKKHNCINYEAERTQLKQLISQ